MIHTHTHTVIQKREAISYSQRPQADTGAAADSKHAAGLRPPFHCSTASLSSTERKEGEREPPVKKQERENTSM
jgi:hypothetical protein